MLRTFFVYKISKTRVTPRCFHCSSTSKAEGVYQLKSNRQRTTPVRFTSSFLMETSSEIGGNTKVKFTLK